jgi:tetratricopeptide (TPR) repeat protein
MSRAEVYLKEHQRAEPGKASQWLEKAAADFDRLEQAGVDLRAAFLHRARIYLAEKKPELCLENLACFLSGSRAAQFKEAVLPEDRARELRTLINELPASGVNAREARDLGYQLILVELDRALKQGRASAKLYGEIGAAEQMLAGLRPKEAPRRLREAIAAYGKGIELDPKDVKLRIKRGWAYVDFNENAPARDDFQAAVALEPDNAEAHTGAGYTLACLKQSAQAKRHANRALFNRGGDYLILHNIACIYAVIAKNEAQREYQDLAIDQLERALAIWRQGGMTEPSELVLIQGEAAFDPGLRKRPEFDRLLKGP